MIAERGEVVLRTADEDDTGLDDAHIPVRRAYESVGFDRQVPSVDLWQKL